MAKGVCVAKEVYGKSGECMAKGASVMKGGCMTGACMAGGMHAGEMATAVDGMHPTGSPDRHPLGRHPPGQTPPGRPPKQTPLGRHPLPSACWDTSPGVATAADGMHPTGMYSCYWPQQSCGQGNIFTPVSHSVHREVSASVHAGIPHPQEQTHTPGADPLGVDTPQSRHTTGVDTPLGADTSQGQTPLGADTPW